MNTNNESGGPDTSAAFFDKLYARESDPWDFRGSPYERARYLTIIEALSDRRYTRALEPGCAIGELTALLSPLCGRIDALDFSVEAVAHARTRCEELGNVQLCVGAVPGDLPQATYDLIIFSEIGYYFTREELDNLTALLWSRLTAGGRLIACHWLGDSVDHRLHGLEVHDTLVNVIPSKGDFNNTQHTGFVLQRWTKAGEQP